jgi:hypothetical protein
MTVGCSELLCSMLPIRRVIDPIVDWDILYSEWIDAREAADIVTVLLRI